MFFVNKTDLNVDWNNQKFVISNYLKTFSFDNKFLLFHPFFLHCIIVDSKIIEYIECLKKKESFTFTELLELINDKDLISILYENHLLCEIGEEIKEIPDHFYNLNKEELPINNLRLVVTTNCNFKCKYCTIYSNSKPSSKIRMNFKIAKKAIDLFFQIKEHDTESKIVFYGGEPLFEQKLLKKTVKYIRSEICSLIPITIITNGSLISEDLCIFLKKYDIRISISIDGLEELNDQMRVYPNGSGTFKDIIKGILLLNKFYIKFGCSCTIGSHNVNRLTNIVEFFQNKCNIDHGLFNYIQFGAPNSQSAKDTANALITTFESNVRKGFSFDGLFSIIQRLIKKTQKIHFCYGCGEMLAIMPNGDISLCHRLGIEGKTILSNVFQNEALKTIINSELYHEINSRSSFTIQECSNCECIGICGGGCYFNAYKTKGSYISKDPEYCDFIKTILNWMIKTIIKNSTI